MVVPAANTTSVAHCYLQDEGLKALQQASDLGDVQRVLQIASQLAALLNLQLDLIRDYTGINGSQPFLELLATPELETTYMDVLSDGSIPADCNNTLLEVLNTTIVQRGLLLDAVYEASQKLQCDKDAAGQVLAAKASGRGVALNLLPNIADGRHCCVRDVPRHHPGR